MKLAGIVATLAFGMSMPATAEEFYAFAAADDNAMVLIEPAQIQAANGGHKVVPLHTVSVDDLRPGAPGPFASLDTTTVEIDCAAPRWKVVSETVRFSLSPTSETIDKTNVNSREWQTLRQDGLYEQYRAFACQWPALTKTGNKATFPDIWAAARRAAAIIFDGIQKSARH